ncbi:hypothetical protein HanXRQr2_Chr17g0801931 [Helianthus annuus]|uniref:Uncharacterized protein n=1 Tax=Helianthus annuus TaxID=4232 RepID=A0A9K3DK77_HELAN|nr:hypothetical protein HanXRQr2_Chr17g0801931 [Helianthus annuus]KAJ0813092.1 hypothetical protein HanPSC8_Chr17g0769521 [Helianthus annuus]
MTKAGEVQSSLEMDHPSCIKMVKGLTDTAYWMGFPLWFGKLFLPKVDSEMVIEDEYGEIHLFISIVVLYQGFVFVLSSTL